MRQLLALFVVCAMFVFGVHPAFAQEVTPEAPVVESPSVVIPDADMEDAANAITTAVANVVLNSPYVVISMTIIVTVVSLLKLIPAANNISAGTLTITVASVFWLGGLILSRMGYEDQFFHYIGVFSDPVKAFGGLIVTLLTAAPFHELAAQLNAPLLGYKRTPETATVSAINGAAFGQPQSVYLTEPPINIAQITRLINEQLKTRLDEAGLKEFNWQPSNETPKS